MKVILHIFLFFLFLSPIASQSINISGYIKSAQNGENLIGATLYDPINSKVKAISNEYGFFSFKTLVSENCKIKFSYVGYEDKNIDLFFFKDTTISVELTAIGLSELVVIANKTDFQRKGVVSFSAEELKKIPTIGGEPDLLRSLQLMPGISNSTESNSNILVRGGTPDQNLILLDGSPVYNVSHLGGFISVFNNDALNKVDVYKGAFPARFGGRLSSVLDIQMKEGNKKKFSGAFSLGLINSKILLEGPIKKDTSSYMFTARSSYLGLINVFKNKAKAETYLDYWLYDINAKVNSKFYKGNIFTSFYIGKDIGTSLSKSTNRSNNVVTSSFDSNSSIDWGNITWSSRYSQIIKNNIFMKSLVGYTRYNYNLNSIENSNIFKLVDTLKTQLKENNHYSLSDKFFKIEFDHNKSENHFLRYGGQFILHRFLPNSIVDSSELTPSLIKSNELSVFLEDDWNILRNLNLNSGIRISNYYVNQKSFLSIEPRLALSFNTSQNHTLKASYSYMQQNIHLLTSGGFGFPNDFWLPATNTAQPEYSNLYTIGSYATVNNKISLSIEVFYKKINNLIDYKANVSSVLDIKNWEKSIFIGGKGTIWGIEFFLEKKSGKVTGFAGYTFSQNERQFKEINQNKKYFFDYHRPHDFEVFVHYQINKKWNINATWVYQSGRRISVPIGLLPLPEKKTTELIFGDKNNATFPNYQRLDIGINKETKTLKGNTKIWSFSIYNTYNYPNTTFLRVNSSAVIDAQGNYLYQNRNIKNVTLFGLIPSFNYTYKF